jgi:hypothetical protein
MTLNMGLLMHCKSQRIVRNQPALYPELCERLLSDRHLPRRQFIRTGGGLFLAVAMPFGLGCSGNSETDAELVNLAVALIVAAVEYSLEDEIKGDVVFENNESQTTSFRSNYNLLEGFGRGLQADQAAYDYDVKPGQQKFGWGGLHARSIGDHLIRLLIPGAQYDSDAFEVG